MHQPRPYGLHAIGLPLTENDEAFVVSITKRITNLKELSKVDSMKMVYDLPDGGYVIVQDMGGNFRVISHKPIHGKDPIFDGIETDYIPMLFSAAITNAVVHEGEGVRLELTEAARLRLVQYSHVEVKPPKTMELQRFRIDYNARFPEFMPRKYTSFFRTQYDQQRPTWYSGAMAEVVQIVGGYGRQDFANLPNEKVNKFERARFTTPKEWNSKVGVELTGLRLPAYTGLPPADGSFQFDYKFNRTNAVSFDDKKRPWLLQVMSSGVWAMPLPIIPATRTEAFRRYMQLVGDEEILAILDRFGAMPSGESFPTGDGFEAWRKAGAIIKVCDSSDFYSHIAYSSALGWSFNTNGTEGYNTCYDYMDVEQDEGMGYGMTYKMKLSMASSDEYYGAKSVSLNDDGPIADKVRKYLSQLLPTLGNSTSKDRAVLYKIRRADSDLIYQRALGRDGTKDKDYWTNLELDPIAKPSGNVSKVYSGYLYHGANFEQQPQIKFPEPFLGGCVSHDFLNVGVKTKEYLYNCDTIMLAYYIGNSLKTVSYFMDWGGYFQEVDSNYEKYMTVGKWYQKQANGRSAVQGQFYSSDIDERLVIAPQTIDTTIAGEDLGYDTVPFFSFDHFFSMVGTISRKRYYSHETTVKTVNQRSLSIAACVPYFCRNAVIQVKHEQSSTSSLSKSMQLLSMTDPYTYRYWTYHKTFAWVNGPIENVRGTPYPVDGFPIWVEQEVVSKTPANSFADNGAWINGRPQEYSWLIYPDKNNWMQSGGGGPPTIQEYSTIEHFGKQESGEVSFSIDRQPYLVNKFVPDEGYYIGSPSISHGLFYREACSVVFGDTQYHSLSERSARARVSSWGYCSLIAAGGAYSFIGVINE